jgi:hypothetical protein
VTDEIDGELRTLEIIARHLGCQPRDACKRILEWATDRYVTRRELDRRCDRCGRGCAPGTTLCSPCHRILDEQTAAQATP